MDRYEERRDQLAESALQTLGERGYARTSLRDIAMNSPFSHGVLHYYFTDKLDLIDYCIRYYKAQCVTRYDAVVSESTTPGGLLDAFAAKLVETILDEAPMHRLWYDIRTQSMFEERLRPAVVYIDQTLEDMVWRIIGRYAELVTWRRRCRRPRRTASRRPLPAAVPATRAARTDALATLVEQVHSLMPLTIGP